MMEADKKAGVPPVDITLARYVCGLHFQDIPQNVVNRAKSRILVVLDCALQGRELPWSKAALNLATSRPGNPETTLLAGSQQLSIENAAFANAVLAHSVLQEDTSPDLGGHDGIITVPTALALGELYHRSGQDILTAIIAGYEVMTRFGQTLGPFSILPLGFRGTPLFGIFGATATAARIMGLDVEATTRALNYAVHVASGLNLGWETGTMEPMFHAGATVRNGILVAAAAKAGFSIAENSIEGKGGFIDLYTNLDENGRKEAARKIIADLGQSFRIIDVFDKPYPAAANQLCTIDIGLGLSSRENLPQQIKKIVAKLAPSVANYPGTATYPPYHSAFEVQMSFPFTLAAAMLGRPMKDPMFYANSYDDAEVAALAQKIELIPEEGRHKYRPRIEAELNDGQVIIVDEDKSSVLVVDDALAQERFSKSAGDTFGETDARKLLQAILQIEKCQDIREILAVWREGFKKLGL